MCIKKSFKSLTNANDYIEKSGMMLKAYKCHSCSPKKGYAVYHVTSTHTIAKEQLVFGKVQLNMIKNYVFPNGRVFTFAFKDSVRLYSWQVLGQCLKSKTIIACDGKAFDPYVEKKLTTVNPVSVDIVKSMAKEYPSSTAAERMLEIGKFLKQCDEAFKYALEHPLELRAKHHMEDVEMLVPEKNLEPIEVKEEVVESPSKKSNRRELSYVEVRINAKLYKCLKDLLQSDETMSDVIHALMVDEWGRRK